MAMKWLMEAARARAASLLESAQGRQRELEGRLRAGPEPTRISAEEGSVSAGELWRLYRSARGSDSARRETLDLLEARAGSKAEGPSAR